MIIPTTERDKAFVAAKDIVIENSENPNLEGALLDAEILSDSDKENYGRAICKIQYKYKKIDRIGSGFFVKVDFNNNQSESLYGVFTCNHILHQEDLIEDHEVRLILNFSKNDIESHLSIFMNNDRFRFTDPLLDVTFIQILPQDKIYKLDDGKCYQREFKYLLLEKNEEAASEYAKNGTKFLFLHHPGGKDLTQSLGKIKVNWGFDLLHNAESEGGSSGSPLLNANHDVIGIHKAASNDAPDIHIPENCKVATNILFVISAIQALYNFKRQSSVGSCLISKQLIQQDFDSLSKLGLQKLNNENLFLLKTASFGNLFKVNFNLLLYRTNHAWYCSPLIGKTLNLVGVEEHDNIILRRWRKITKGPVFNWKFDQKFVPCEKIYPFNELLKEEFKFFL